MLTPWKESYDQPRQHIKKLRHYFAKKVQLVKAVVFPVVMYGCESWTIKKAECWRIYAFELWCWRRFLRVPSTARRSNQSILKEISPGCFGGTVVETETLMLWPSDEKRWLIGKDPEAGKNWRQEEKGMTEDKMVGWHHWLNGYEFEQALGVGEVEGSLVCCSSWGHKWLETTEKLNNKKKKRKTFLFTITSTKAKQNT